MGNSEDALSATMSARSPLDPCARANFGTGRIPAAQRISSLIVLSARAIGRRSTFGA